MTESKRPHFARAGVTMLLTSLYACGGGHSSAPIATYTVGGTVTGLKGGGLVLQDNSGAGLAVSAPGAFTFMGELATGSAYSVTAATQPPAQQCEVSNGSGTVGTADVTSVAVACIPVPFTALANQPPESGYLALLLTDGSVMMQSINDAGVF